MTSNTRYVLTLNHAAKFTVRGTYLTKQLKPRGDHYEQRIEFLLDGSESEQERLRWYWERDVIGEEKFRSHH